jgi:hypothetical protein
VYEWLVRYDMCRLTFARWMRCESTTAIGSPGIEKGTLQR